MFNDGDKAEQGCSAPSAGIPRSAKCSGQFCAHSHNQSFSRCWEMLWERGRASAQPWCVCNQLHMAPLDPHWDTAVLSPVCLSLFHMSLCLSQGWKVQHSTALCLRVSPIAASSPPAPPQHPLGWGQGCQPASSLET